MSVSIVIITNSISVRLDHLALVPHVVVLALAVGISLLCVL